jgi:hypothetical protein
MYPVSYGIAFRETSNLELLSLVYTLPSEGQKNGEENGGQNREKNW